MTSSCKRGPCTCWMSWTSINPPAHDYTMKHVLNQWPIQQNMSLPINSELTNNTALKLFFGINIVYNFILQQSAKGRKSPAIKFRGTCSSLAGKQYTDILRQVRHNHWIHGPGSVYLLQTTSLISWIFKYYFTKMLSIYLVNMECIHK